MTISPDVLTEMPAEPLEAVERRIRDGDLLLCAAHDPFSRLIAWATGSPWTHVAVAFRWNTLGRVMVFESVQHFGVRAVPLAKFVAQTSSGVKPFPGKIVLARHGGYAGADSKTRSDAKKRMADFAIDRFGDPFAPLEILKIGARIVFGKLGRPMPHVLVPKDAFICSEYVAKCLETVGIKIPWDGLGFIAPCDLAEDPRLKAVARVKT